MRITAMTDLHEDLDNLVNAAGDLAAADLVLLSGDLTDFGRRDAIARVIDAVRRHNPNILAIPGNCDRAEVGDYLDREGINLHGRHLVRDGLCFVGLGGSLPCPDHTLNELTDERMGELLVAAIRGAPKGLPLVGLFHQPPHGTVNDDVGGRHVGSRSIRAFIEEFQPLVCFTGHIHEGRGIDRIGKSRVANPGPLREGSWTVAEIAGADPAPERHGRRSVGKWDCAEGARPNDRSHSPPGRTELSVRTGVERAVEQARCGVSPRTASGRGHGVKHALRFTSPHVRRQTGLHLVSCEIHGDCR